MRPGPVSIPALALYYWPWLYTGYGPLPTHPGYTPPAMPAVPVTSVHACGRCRAGVDMGPGLRLEPFTRQPLDLQGLINQY